MLARVAPFENYHSHHDRRLHRDNDASVGHDNDDGRNHDLADFLSGERMCQPHVDNRGTGALQIYALVAAIVAVSWALIENPGDWQSLMAETATSVVGAKVRSDAPSVPPPSETEQRATATLAPLPATTIVEPPALLGDVVTVADDAAASAVGHQSDLPQRLTEPVIDPSDRHTKRALAAGLNPELSRAVLERLSNSDYQNAAYAIKTALRRPVDAAPLTWPAKARPNDAIFEVKFVQSADAHCRRYVVTVSKSGWSTTALPMETCSLTAK